MANKVLTGEQVKFLEKEFGWPGCMLSRTKSGYEEHRPKNVAIFNSNIIIEGYGKVWFGDFDLSIEEDKLKNLSKAFDGAKVYLLYEMDGRFENEKTPKIEDAVYQTDGVSGEVGKTYQEYFKRDKDSKIIVRENDK